MTATTILLLLIVALVGLVVYLAHAGKLAELEANFDRRVASLWSELSDHQSQLSDHDDAIDALSPDPTSATASQTASDAPVAPTTVADDQTTTTSSVQS